MSFNDLMLNKIQVATLIGCVPRSLERRVRDGHFPPALRFGKEVFWFQSVVHQWLERQRDQQLAWEPQPVPSRKASAKTSADQAATPKRSGALALPIESIFSTDELNQARAVVGRV